MPTLTRAKFWTITFFECCYVMCSYNYEKMPDDFIIFVYADCLDNGNNKKAIQEADRILKKQRDFSCAKVRSYPFHLVHNTYK